LSLQSAASLKRFYLQQFPLLAMQVVKINNENKDPWLIKHAPPYGVSWRCLKPGADDSGSV